MRVRRIELRSSAWEALVLPLNYTRVSVNLAKFLTPSEQARKRLYVHDTPRIGVLVPHRNEHVSM